MNARTWLSIAAVAALAGAALPATAAGQDYEPQRRMRTAYDSCLKNEVLQGAWCVRKCDEGFRMNGSGPTARCVGLSPDAKYRPPEPEFKPQPRNPNAPKVPGA